MLTTQSLVSFLHHIFDLIYSLYPHLPSLASLNPLSTLVTTIRFSVSMRLWGFFFCSFAAFYFIFYMSKTIWFLFFNPCIHIDIFILVCINIHLYLKKQKQIMSLDRYLQFQPAPQGSFQHSPFLPHLLSPTLPPLVWLLFLKVGKLAVICHIFTYLINLRINKKQFHNPSSKMNLSTSV